MSILAIHAAVGPSQPNHEADVRIVQRFLNNHTHATKKQLLHVTGHYNPETESAILKFQREVMGIQLPNGIVGIGSLTADRLARSSIATFCRSGPWESNSCKVGVPNESDYTSIAAALSCEVAAVKAVVTVETRGKGGFYPAGRRSSCLSGIGSVRTPEASTTGSIPIFQTISQVATAVTRELPSQKRQQTTSLDGYSGLMIWMRPQLLSRHRGEHFN